MKTLKERVSELQKEIENRIIEGQFFTTNVDKYLYDFDFFNKITIDIDGLEFSFSVSKCKTYLCQHDGLIKIEWKGYKVGELKHLYEQVEDKDLKLKEMQLKKLQDEIRSLQTK